MIRKKRQKDYYPPRIIEKKVKINQFFSYSGMKGIEGFGPKILAWDCPSFNMGCQEVPPGTGMN